MQNSLSTLPSPGRSRLESSRWSSFCALLLRTHFLPSPPLFIVFQRLLQHLLQRLLQGLPRPLFPRPALGGSSASASRFGKQISSPPKHSRVTTPPPPPPPPPTPPPPPPSSSLDLPWVRGSPWLRGSFRYIATSTVNVATPPLSPRGGCVQEKELLSLSP